MPTRAKTKYLICIPTYNEAENIAKLIRKIWSKNLSSADILVVDDNSPDQTGKIAENLKNSGPNQVYVLNRQNKDGLGKAYIAGFKWALERDYTHVLGMDADFSHDPNFIPEIIEQSKSHDLVIGSRYVAGGKIQGWHWYRYLNSWGANIVTRSLLGLKPKDTTSGFRCYSERFLKSLNLDRIVATGYAFLVEMLSLAQDNNFSIAEVPITFCDRREGQSKIAGELKRSIKTVILLAIRKKSYRQFTKFSIVGASGTMVDLGIYNLLAVLLGINIYTSRSISFTLAATNNYIFNRIWTFRSLEKKIALQFSRYFLISVIGLILNLGIMRLLETWSLRFRSIFIQKNIPVLIAIVIVLIWNYTANKKWTFHE